MKSQTTALSVYGLKDLIAGVTPTLTGWTVNPIDGINITDGNTSTFCATGSKSTTGAWQFGYFEWDFGGTYEVMTTGLGKCITVPGNPYIFIEYYLPTGWMSLGGCSNSLAEDRIFLMSGIKCSKVRLGLCNDSAGAATITPHIGQFNAWRIK